MSASSVKWPNWGAGFRDPAIPPCADFLQTSSLSSDLLITAIVCLGGVYKYVFPEKSCILEIIEIKLKITPGGPEIFPGAHRNLFGDFVVADREGF